MSSLAVQIDSDEDGSDKRPTIAQLEKIVESLKKLSREPLDNKRYSDIFPSHLFVNHCGSDDLRSYTCRYFNQEEIVPINQDAEYTQMEVDELK